jgi:hypothetical protein
MIHHHGFEARYGRVGSASMLEAGTVRQMPIRLPEAETIRREIAERAAHVSSASMDHYLELLGPVEPALTHGGGESAWRLAYYQGSREEHDAIERAVGQVQRETPLMRVD